MLNDQLRRTLLLALAVAISGCGACDTDNNIVDEDIPVFDTDMGVDMDEPDTGDAGLDMTVDPTDMNDEDMTVDPPDMGDDDMGGDDDMTPDMPVDTFDPLQTCLMDCNYDGPRADEVDCDFDGLSQTEEASLGTDPCDNDTDGDGLSDLRELQEGTDALVPDTDGDGLNDADELFFNFDPNNPSTLNDNILDGDRWIVVACDDAQSEPVDYYSNAPGDWQIALPPAFSNYAELTIAGAGVKEAAAVFDDTANEVTGFILSNEPSAGQTTAVDVLLDYVPAGAGGPLRQVGQLQQGSNGGDFFTHDFHTASIGRYLIRTSQPRSARQVRDQLLFSIAPFGAADVTGLPNSAGATYQEFRVFISGTVRESAVQGPRVITSVAIAPASKYDTRDKVQFRMDDLTNTTNVSSAADDHEVSCAQFRAGEGNPEADFYWVLDQSGSMSDDFARVNSVANQFFGELNNTALDYRLGVVPMDEQIAGRVRVPPGWHTDVNTFIGEIDDFVVGCAGCGGSAGFAEWGLDSGKRGIEWMRSSSAPQNVRIRPEAQLITIFMSDEEAQSIQDDGLNTNTGQQLMADFKQFYQANTIVFSIVGDGNGCGLSDGEAYRQVALSTGGSFASLCATDISETIEDIIFAATGLASNYQIPNTPISSTLRVFKNDGSGDGVWVPRSRVNGFDYFAQSNSIAFFGTFRPEPADPTMGRYGDDIAVTYQTFIDRTKD